MSTGFIDHIGIAVPDLVIAKAYYDELMQILGLERWFETSPEFNYGPGGSQGTQIFFYEARDLADYSRFHPGLHHLAFRVESRDAVEQAYNWAINQGNEILEKPSEFPQYGEHCYASYWLDPHGFKLEVFCHDPVNDELAS
jgi:catechol 2,3-dioxygenase-like lactoylglutathione lyase family enzyme